MEREIIAKVKNCPLASTCQVAIDSLTSFDWDKMYVFDSTFNQRDREKVLGIKDEGFVEFERQLVFLKDRKIVHQESEPTGFEGIVKNEILYDPSDDVSWQSYPRSTVFTATEQQGKSGLYFVLKQHTK